VAGTSPGAVPISVTAVSTAHPSVSSTANGTLTVASSGVKVTLNPPSAGPGSPYQMTVTNTGTSTDQFDLALAGPAGLVATLGARSITLAAGASQTVSIATTAVSFALPGPLGLTAFATSHSSPDVRAAASADLIIAPSTGMTAQFSPPAQTLPAPGPATFLLQVDNTGNTEDLYSATISGTSGPVIASLVGLDGLPTQSISLFRLPGLATGTISLQATLTGPGQGTVTVVVKSLSTGQVTTITAMVAANTDGPKVTLMQRYGIHMMPTTLVLTFDQPLDPAHAQDVHEYHLVDTRGHAVPIKSAVYDPATLTVTLHFKRRLDLHHKYKLTVDGATPSGLTGTSGLLLDGKASGQPGSNYLATINWRDLVLPPNWNPKWSSKPEPAKVPLVTGRHQLFQRSVSFPTHSPAKSASAKPGRSTHPRKSR
jgi:hypothetical protein